ncbi:MAG: M20/M25/M40 family metallo-hydrolase [Longimicrobiales bacterium]
MTTPPFAAALAFAQDLIRIPGAPGCEGDVAVRVAAEFERLAFDEVYTDEVGNVIGIIRGNADAPPVMLSSHMDVVDVGDSASWEYPPYDAVVADGYLHGRGAMDIKGPLAIQTYAAAHFVGRPPAGDIIVAHTVLEERGGWGMEHLMNACEESTTRVSKPGVTHIRKPGAVIIGEATNGDICVGHRGRAEIIIDVIGLAGHASAPERARNPLDVLPSLLPALQSFSAKLVEIDPLLGRSSAVPTAIETLPRSRNVIPDIARVVLDWRVLPFVTAENAVTMLRQHLDRNVTLPEGFGMDIRYSVERQRTYTGKQRDRRMFTPGFLLDPQHAVAKAAVAVIKTESGRMPAIRPWTFATDGGHTCGVHGIPTIGYAPGEERYAHTNRERLALDQAEQVYNTYPKLIAAVSATIGMK